MDAQKQLVVVNGKDKTDSVESYQFSNGKCEIVYQNSQQVYSYNKDNVCILKLRRKIDPKTIIFKANGRVIADMEVILDFGSFYRVIRPNRKAVSYPQEAVEISQNCLAVPKSGALFQYFKETASAVSLVTDSGTNILSLQYARVGAVEAGTVLEKYLDCRKAPEEREWGSTLIYPFGLNRSQKIAVENAFSSQVSIIQGPPGTGKTQTILNIIANAVCNGKTVAVVSNNNSATANVAEKLAKENLSFLTAYLGSLQNKEQFLAGQTGAYPNMSTWVLDDEARQKLDAEAASLSKEVDAILRYKNRIAEISQELMTLQAEQFHFREYYGHLRGKMDISVLRRLSSSKLMALWVAYEDVFRQSPPSTWQKLWMAIRYTPAVLPLFRALPAESIPYLQDLFYKKRISELQMERRELEARLRNFQFERKMQQLREKSMRLFKAELSRRYPWKGNRQRFEKNDFRGDSEEFNREYPIVLSTTYSIKGTLSTEHIYDYVIMDEASQVDLVTGVLALSCARNVVIVGDQKQLPNVLTPEEIQTADALWNPRKFDERYHFATHSLLSSAAEIWEKVPTTLLREHYRCHPKIAGFFNQKFYNGELIVMTKDAGEPDALTVYRTAEGNHSRGHTNQRQIDVIEKEVLPSLKQRGYGDIGIITPYRDQVTAIQKQLGGQCEVATVHKFQGREKEAVILSSVDDVIGDFVDNPNMLNVAVSRAVKSLSVVISGDRRNERTNYGDLVRYIEYHNYRIVESKVYSVFDLLYKQRYQQRLQYLKKHKRISEYDSENLAYSVIEEILKMPEFSDLDCVVHASLATLVKDISAFTELEAHFAANPLTHVDFLLFHRMDKSPVLVIEVDGVRFHKQGSKQAVRDKIKDSVLDKCQIPLLRIRTNESGERERIIAMLKDLHEIQ